MRAEELSLTKVKAEFVGVGLWSWVSSSQPMRPSCSPSQNCDVSLIQTRAPRTAALHMERQGACFHYLRMMTKCSCCLS